MPSRLKLPLLTLCLALAFYAGDASAQGAKASSAAEFARQADQLKPGQWVWAPNVAQAGPLLIYVDLSRQLASVYRNGVRIGVSTRGLRALIIEVLELDPRPAYQARQLPVGDPKSLGTRHGFDLLGHDIKYEIREDHFLVHKI